MADAEIGTSERDLKQKRCKPQTKLRRVFKVTFHVVFFLHHVLANIFGAKMLVQALKSQVDTVKDLALYPFGYGTNWNFTFQTIYLVLALLHDGVEWSNRGQTAFGIKLKYWKDVVFCGMVFPVTCFVSSMFWSLYAIDRELVFPTVYDEVVPWWFNHCVHTNILIVIAIETILEGKTQPTDRRLETMLIWGVNMAYTAVYYSVYFFANRWLYHIFAVLNWWQICLYQLLIWFSAYFYYLLQYPIYRLIHGSKKLEINKSTRLFNIETVINDKSSKFVDLVKRNKVKDLSEDNFSELKDECDMKPINLKYRL